jgi:hypothetical protein
MCVHECMCVCVCVCVSVTCASLALQPTRELAQQIDEECQKFAAFTKIRAHSIVGGLSISEQSLMLREGLEVLVGTPGRIVDCLQVSKTSLWAGMQCCDDLALVSFFLSLHLFFLPFFV